MGKKNSTMKTLDNLIEEEYGKKGTAKRDKFEEGYESFKVGFLIQQARIEKGLTQQELADKCGTNKGYISKNRPCDNCDGNGQIKFTETCPICKGYPGVCREILELGFGECSGICFKCAGEKRIIEYSEEIKERKCPFCKGSGECTRCNGQGQVYGIKCAFCNGHRSCQKCLSTGTLMEFASSTISCPDCHGTGKCLKNYPSNDNKCHGKGEITYIIQKNPKITQADKDELAQYIAQQKKEIAEFVFKMKQEAELKALKAKQEEAQNLTLKANQFFNQNKYDEALKYYNQSLNTFPDSSIEIKKQRVSIILDSIKQLNTYVFNIFVSN